MTWLSGIDHEIRAIRMIPNVVGRILASSRLASDFRVEDGEAVGAAVCEAGSDGDVSWPFNPGEAGGAAVLEVELELGLAEPLLLDTGADTPEEEELGPGDVAVRVPVEILSEEVTVALVVPGPVEEVAIPEEEDGADVVDDVDAIELAEVGADAVFFCASPA